MLCRDTQVILHGRVVEDGESPWEGTHGLHLARLHGFHLARPEALMTSNRDERSKGPRRSASVPLSLISQNAVSPREALRVLTDAFAADDYLECIADLTKLDIDPQAYIDGLDRVGPVYSQLNESGTLTFSTCPLSADRHPKA